MSRCKYGTWKGESYCGKKKLSLCYNFQIKNWNKSADLKNWWQWENLSPLCVWGGGAEKGHEHKQKCCET